MARRLARDRRYHRPVVPHIVVATDARFALPTAVMLRSLVAHAGFDTIDVTVLHERVSPELQTKVAASVPSGGATLRWVDVNLDRLGELPATILPTASWFRLLAVDAAPAAATRVLYLDVDMLVCASLVELWTADLHGEPMAAVRSVNFPSIGTYGGFDHWRRYAVDPRLPYFNSGLLLIDTEAWRREAATEQIVRFMGSGDNHGGDQQALNIHFAGRWHELDPRWNQQTPLLDDRRGGHLLYDDPTIDAARAEPAIIHFMDRPKPWHRGCTHPAREWWRAAAAETAFAPYELERDPIRDQIGWRIRRAASALVKGR